MRYTNCSYVDGNLELTGLTKLYDLSFLQHIEEVDGYVIVVNVFCHYLHLKNLRIIRVKQLHDNKYSLYIVLNHNPRNDNEGLMELQFVNLKEIMGGMVFFHNNNLLCFENSIRWDDINPTQKPPYSIIFDSKNYRRPCPQCDHKCYNKVTGHYHCWGTGEHMCQQLNYIKGMCSDTCDGRCFGPDPNQCCHSECAAGCTSQKKTECVTCKNFYNEGECHPFCPKMEVYDSRQMKWVDNPNGRYSFGSLCVKECPEWLTMARTLRSSIREKLQEEFLCCKICLEPYRQPKALPCLHSFCENCLRDYVRRHTGSCLGYFPCPMCRRDIRVPYGGIKHFQDNFLLSNLSDTLEEDDTWQDLHHCRLPTPKSLAQTSPLEEEFRDHKLTADQTEPIEKRGGDDASGQKEADKVMKETGEVVNETGEVVKETQDLDMLSGKDDIDETKTPEETMETEAASLKRKENSEAFPPQKHSRNYSCETSNPYTLLDLDSSPLVINDQNA